MLGWSVASLIAATAAVFAGFDGLGGGRTSIAPVLFLALFALSASGMLHTWTKRGERRRFAVPSEGPSTAKLMCEALGLLAILPFIMLALMLVVATMLPSMLVMLPLFVICSARETPPAKRVRSFDREFSGLQR
ncbi:MAG: hypothetical protein ABIP39_03600 [Polyangiaceae bacterium]